MAIERVLATEKAKAIINKLRETHGELIFHLSGGCCDGTAPMCFEKGEFLIGARDVCLGSVHGCKFYMASDQFEYFKYMQMTIDISKGRGSSFSLEIPLGLRFMLSSRLLDDKEVTQLLPVEMNTNI